MSEYVLDKIYFLIELKGVFFVNEYLIYWVIYIKCMFNFLKWYCF